MPDKIITLSTNLQYLALFSVALIFIVHILLVVNKTKSSFVSALWFLNLIIVGFLTFNMATTTQFFNKIMQQTGNSAIVAGFYAAFLVEGHFAFRGQNKIAIVASYATIFFTAAAYVFVLR